MKELVIGADTENLEEVLAFVDAELEANDCPMKIQIQLDIAVEEMFVNIAHYAYQGAAGEAVIRMEIIKEEKTTVEITFIDRGIPYNPLEKEDPDITLSADERQVGGLGIYMVKQSMSHVDYHYSDGQNIFTMSKEL